MNRRERRARRSRLSDGQCVHCFSHDYLRARGAEKLDYESEVEGLIAAVQANGYTNLAQIPQEALDAELRDHAAHYDGASEELRRRESIIIAALERQWERAHVEH